MIYPAFASQHLTARIVSSAHFPFADVPLLPEAHARRHWLHGGTWFLRKISSSSAALSNQVLLCRKE